MLGVAHRATNAIGLLTDRRRVAVRVTLTILTIVPVSVTSTIPEVRAADVRPRRAANLVAVAIIREDRALGNTQAEVAALQRQAAFITLV